MATPPLEYWLLIINYQLLIINSVIVPGREWKARSLGERQSQQTTEHPGHAEDDQGHGLVGLGEDRSEARHEEAEEGESGRGPASHRSGDKLEHVDDA